MFSPVLYVQYIIFFLASQDTKPNGVAAKTRKTEVGYILNIEKEGVYTLNYTVVTPKGEVYTKKITMTAVLDTEKPVINGLKGEVGSLSIGDTLTIPEILVSDNSILILGNKSRTMEAWRNFEIPSKIHNENRCEICI